MAVNEDDTPRALVLLTAVPALEEPLTDWMLADARVAGTGFTCVRVGGYGSRLEGLGPAEQVMGRRNGIQFQLVLLRQDLDDFLAAIEQDFAGADLRYAVLPLLRQGPAG